MECFSLNLWKRIIQYFIGKNNRRPRFPKKAIAAFLAPAKMCLQISFCFKVLAPAIWQPCSNMVTASFCSLRSPALYFLKWVKAISPKERVQRQEGIAMRNTWASLYRSPLGDCAVHVLKPGFCFKPHCHSRRPHSSLWFPGVTGSLSPRRTQPLTLPTATGLRKSGAFSEQACSQGQQRPC